MPDNKTEPMTSVVVVTVCKGIYKLVRDLSRGWPEVSIFKLLLHWGVGKGAPPLSGLLQLTLDPYFMVLSVKQGGIK